MLILFHTDGCHLCEQAWALVEQAGLAVRHSPVRHHG